MVKRKITKKALEQLSTRELVERGLVALLSGVPHVQYVKAASDNTFNGVSFMLPEALRPLSLGYPISHERINTLQLQRNSYSGEILEEEVVPSLTETIKRKFPNAYYSGNIEDGYYVGPHMWHLPMRRLTGQSGKEFGYLKCSKTAAQKR